VVSFSGTQSPEYKKDSIYYTLSKSEYQDEKNLTHACLLLIIYASAMKGRVFGSPASRELLEGVKKQPVPEKYTPELPSRTAYDA